MQNFNMHTHTYRCGHAKGSETEYIEAAIDAGFKTLGFSEHIAFEGWDSEFIRPKFENRFEYYDAINAAKEKYKGKIKIYLGTEFEYFDENDEYYNEVKNYCDYMIIGEHNVKKFGEDLYRTCTDEMLDDYARLIETALEKGYTKYVAHPSYFMITKDKFTEKCEQTIEKIAKAAKKYEAALEINLKGMRYGIKKFGDYESYIYPHKKALEIIKEIKPYVVIGYDAHSPKVLFEREYEQIARCMADGLKIIDDPEFFLK